MAFENLVGVQVVDEAGYQAYRDAMMPILHRYGGDFGYDFKIAETLRSPTDALINRLFTIYFPDESAFKAFFADEAYLQVRQRFFEPSVTHTTILSAYQRD